MFILVSWISLLFFSIIVVLLQYLQNKKTKNGVTLEKILISGNTYPDSSIGVYAGDLESYDTFAPIFDAAILYYHKKDSHTPNMKVPTLTVRFLLCIFFLKI
eukprot:Pompholyxophrys_punicea_v1_NODE_848_length_1219_cov_8.963918.p1 type:complete len:102 gc:universal NODE_848_length_1219_cov_8.963918:657-962(+)